MTFRINPQRFMKMSMLSIYKWQVYVCIMYTMKLTELTIKY